MKIARRYILLQRIVWLQSALCVALAVYVLAARKKVYPLNVTVHESTPIDLSFLDLITNRVEAASSPAPAAPVAVGTAEGAPPVRRLPFRFDGFCVVDGHPCAFVGSRVFRVGDNLNGRIVESVSPFGVFVSGEFYEFDKQPKEVTSKNG